jgi:LuxR family transcriptional regulator, maltose regulon positive regulatory protein
MPGNQFQFLRTKLHRPRVMAGWITRPRLLNQLDQALEKPITLISAPAGYGKTTILAQWLEQCPLPKAWLQLDENDNELPMFFTGVVAALRQVFPECLQKTADLLLSSLPVPLSVWQTTLMSDLDDLVDQPFVLALDDYHLLNNPEIDQLLYEILCWEASPLHLVISTRRNPAISFTRLMVQGQIVEIRAADLRFTETEVAAYLNRVAIFHLSETAINQLQQKTEGWPVGLALVAIKLREIANPEELIANLDGSDYRISDYFLNQVFNQQPVNIQIFLLKAAVLDNFCAPLLQAISGSEQSIGQIQALLEQIEGTQLFLTPLDNQHYWFRYHHLFRQMLLARQHLYFGSDEIEQIHQRAATWLTENRLINEAIRHLVTIQDWNTAAQLAESQLCHLLNSENYQGINHLLAYFPNSFIDTRPGLLLMQAWIAHISMRFPLLLSLVDKIQQHLDAAPPHNDEAAGAAAPVGFEVIPAAVVQAQMYVLRSLYYFVTNQGKETITSAQQALEHLPESWMYVRGNAMLYLGFAMFMEGDFYQVIATFTQEYEKLTVPNSPYGVRLLFCIASIYLLNGDLERSRLVAEQLLQATLTANLRLLQGWAYYLLGRVYMEWNQLEEAAMYYSAVIDQRYSSNLIAVLESSAGYIYVQDALGHRTQAQLTRDLLHQFQSEQPGPANPGIVAQNEWQSLLEGNREKARRWAESFDKSVAQESMIWFFIPQIYKVKILMELGEPGNFQVADRLLNEVQTVAEQTHNTFTRVRALCLRSVMLMRQGQKLEALQTLEQAVRLARPGRFMRTFLEQGPEMQVMLAHLISQLKAEPDLAEYIQAILNAVPAPTSTTSAPLPGHSLNQTLLTEREQQVLELLAERLSIREISAKLFISTNTVQQHTHHIYRKLGVRNKRQAVATALKLGIINHKN